MKTAEMRSRLGEINTELETMNPEELTDEQSARFDELSGEAETLIVDIEKAEERAAARARLTEAVAAGETRSVPGEDRGAPQVNVGKSKSDPYDLSEVRTFGVSPQAVATELRSRAEDAIERSFIPDDQKAQAVKTLRSAKDGRGDVAKLILATGTDDYLSAFGKGLAGRQHMWTADESRAVQRAEEMRAALSTTDANGGFAIPFTLDPSVILTNDGTANSVRQIARNVQITTNDWNPVTSAGVSASWDGEVAEVSDDSPTFAQPSITAEKAQAFVQGSIEINQDFSQLQSEVLRMFADAKDRLEGAAFINGTGTNQPTGIITELDGGSSEVSPATAETFALADVYATLEGLAPRYRRQGRTSWLMNLGTEHAIRQFATDDGNALLARLGDGFTRELLGYRIYETSDMDSAGDINAAATADNHILLVGDFENYVVVDRVGGSVEFIPHLFNTANNLPDGRRGWFYHWRVGAGSVNDAAFSVLNVATSV